MEGSGETSTGEWILKIAGIILGIITFRWIVTIFKGKDQIMSVNEFLKMLGVLFFLIASGYMIYKEGNRTIPDQVYGPAYIAIVFGSLLTVLHLEKGLDLIIQILEKLIDLKKPLRGSDENKKAPE